MNNVKMVRIAFCTFGIATSSPYAQACDLPSATCKNKRQEGLSGSSVHGIRTALSKVLQVAVEWGCLTTNYARGLIVGDRSPKKESKFLSPSQVRTLANALPEPCRTIVLLLALTGLRIGELLPLRRKHLDLSIGVIRVRETVYEGQFGSPKTRISRRDVPMSGPVRELLMRLSANAEHDDLVFRGRAGTPINSKTSRIVYSGQYVGNWNYQLSVGTVSDTRTQHY